VPTSRLHDVYLAAYQEAAHLFAAGVRISDVEFARRAGSLSAVERVIALFALHDATNGTPPRGRIHFDRAVQGGARALAQLGLKPLPEAEAA
jgi:hypothetical protein